MTNEEYRQLLKKYMAHIKDCEGCDFIINIGDYMSNQSFSNNEMYLIREISEEITNESLKNKDNQVCTHCYGTGKNHSDESGEADCPSC